MTKPIRGRFAAGLVLAAATAATATALDARQQRVSLPLECELTLDAETLPIRAEPFDVRAHFTQAVGDTLSVRFAEESRVTVVAVVRASEEEPNALRVTVNTSEAQAGQWPVTLHGEAGECTGTATVAPVDPTVP